MAILNSLLQFMDAFWDQKYLRTYTSLELLSLLDQQ